MTGRGLRDHVRAHGSGMLSGVDAVALSHFGSHGFSCGGPGRPRRDHPDIVGSHSVTLCRSEPFQFMIV